MTGPLNYARLVIGGQIDAVQGWSVGLSLDVETPPTTDELVAWLPDAATAVEAWWGDSQGPKTINKPGCVLSQLAAYGYTAPGTPAVASAVLAVGPLAGINGPEQPSQCSLVASLKTPYPGRRNQGRIYIPFTAGGFITNGLVQAATAQTIAQTTAALIVALAATTINGTTTAAALIAGSGDSQFRYVSSVVVDTVPDTQRRRADKYVGVKHTAPSNS
uniref:Uncharacterized protein n=1 Tax=uncultured prokaryote TaxID=198431 RepID=A0A0H5QP74_9ZZZZ|nr:hypothetical protein [uncultured prokaryote]